MCGMAVHIPCASAHFYVSQCLETNIKTCPVQQLARCEIPGDKIEGKEEFEGKGKEMLLVSFYSLYFSCFLPRKFM